MGVAIDPGALMGEAGICPIAAIVAIAYMMARGAGPWYGYQRETNSAVEFVARLWYTQPDPTPGARFAFSMQDMESPRVQEIVRGRRLLMFVRCGPNSGIAFY